MTATPTSALPAHQAHALASSSTQQEAALLQTTDLWTPDLNDDDLPPPPYGEAYGEIGNEKDGVGTTALVANDGRVNIRINQISRHLSQIFNPALRQQIQAAHDGTPPPAPLPPPFAPDPQRADEEDPLQPPPLNVVIQVVGSRGDVQPFVALGKLLKERYGHRVRLATHPQFASFVQDHGLEFFSIGGNPARLMVFMTKNPSLVPGFRSLASGDIGERRKDVGEYIQGCWRSCFQTGDGMDPSIDQSNEGVAKPEVAAKPFVADCIIANPPSFAHIHCAEKLGVPLHIMFTMPYSPTQSFAHPLANIQSSNADPQLSNFISYAMIELLSWQCLGDIINRFRKKCLDLDPISSIWGPGMLQRLKVPHTYCWSPALIPKPRDWGTHISIPGFYFLKTPDYTPAADLRAFLDTGPTPIYIGFGSIVLNNPTAMTELVFKAARKTGQRLLLSAGWGAIGADHVPDGVFVLADVPHDWLFRHVSCVVHHGGAGTTAAGIKAGRPTVVVPFFGDQPFWGAMLARAGAGPDPIPHKQLTADKLAAAINFCLRPESRECAKELADKVAAEQGCDLGARSFHQHLDVDRLRCSFIPSRPAVWRVKRTQIRLSALAAYTLMNADLLDYSNLKLFRAREYYTDEGPLDPISGGFTAAMRAFSGMAMGLADVPTETWKALQMPLASGRRHSHAVSESTAATIPTSTSRSKASSQVTDRLTPSSSPAPSQTSLTPQPDLTRFRRSVSSPTHQSAPVLNTASSSRMDHSSRWSNVNDKDMLRQTGPHTSKGVGRFVRALVQSPVDLSVNFTKGFHNVPKLWGDDTVRPQESVRDFKTGLRAVGREFGFGWYDGVTGLVTQPWKGAQTEGASGFVKGIGKGLGGFIVKPGAACVGILGHTMKGIHKEVQNLFCSGVQSYITASRAAQGHEEWLQTSDSEIQDIIARWIQLRKELQKKGHHKETPNTGAELRSIRSESSAPNERDRRCAGHGLSSHSADAGTGDVVNDFTFTTTHDRQESADAKDIVPEYTFQPQPSSIGVAAHCPGNAVLRSSTMGRESEAEQLASWGHGEKRSAAQAEWERSQYSSDSELGSVSVVDSDDTLDEELELTEGKRERMTHVVDTGPSTSINAASYDPGHLAGTTQREFEAQRRKRRGEKGAEEKAEEEIVLEYIRKQSLLEAQHHGKKGKSRAIVTTDEDEDDADLQKALKLSLQERK